MSSLRASPSQYRRIVIMLVVGALSVVATGLTTNDLTRFAYDAFSRTDVIECIELVVLYTPFYMLIYGSAVFQLDDYGELRRRLKHVPAPRSEIESIYNRHSSDLLMLVPSYKEDEEVVRQTLMSAALVEYPRRNVVLLIDDPPYPIAQDDVARLAAARRLAAELQRLFDGPARRLRAELSDFIERERYERIDTQKECLHLAALYDFAAGWLELQAANFRICKSTLNHTDQLFIEKILRAPAAAHRQQAFALKKGSLRNTSHLHEYRRLASLFDVEFASFERKRYANLSHAANKAMNLNSYLALVGKSFRKTVRHDGVYLERCDEQHATLTVPDVKYVVTLDADTLLLSDYALTLINIMEKPGNERLAVAQTPYSAVPNSPVLLERLAGATTDIQFLNHQGMTYFNATSWVGANALLRRAALEDIAVEVEERGHPIKVFIQDKTVVEDTGATVDLILKGWTLYNYPERLSYSATPPDFGALLIQRRRWANGGLLFLPDLLRYIWQRPAARLAEGLMRFYYLMSTAVITVGVLIIIFYRFDDSMVSVWLPFAAFPYQLLYGSDLVLAGYRWTDLPRVYALNMLLIPINLGGALQSLQQICTGRKAAFKRTPKVSGRTSVPFIYLVAEYGLLFYCLFSTTADLIDHRYYHMMFSTLNSVAFLYAVSRFIGFRESWQDAKTFFLSRRWWPEVAFAGRQGPAISGGEQSAFAHLIPIAVEDTERRSLERI